MNIFFHPDASRAEKVSSSATCVLIFAFCFVLLPAFVPAPRLDSGSRMVALALTPVVIAAAWIWPPFRVPPRSTLKKVLLSVALAPLVCIALWVLIAKGGGLAATYAVGKRTTEPYRVSMMLTSSGRSGCRRTLMLLNARSANYITACVDRSVWNRIRLGDTVEATVVGSRFGYSVRDVLVRER